MCYAYAEPNKVIETYQDLLVNRIAMAIAERHPPGLAAIDTKPKSITDDYIRWVFPMDVDITGSSVVCSRLNRELAAMGFRMGGHVVDQKNGTRGFEYDLLVVRGYTEESFV